MHFMQAANMLGLPAITVPVAAVPATHSLPPAGKAAAAATAAQDGPLLPVGLQIMAPAWHEASLLHAAAVLEAAVAQEGLAPPVPPVWFDMLAARQGGADTSAS